MLELEIPGRGTYRLEHLVLDLNGTIAQDGELIPGVEEAVKALRKSLTVHLATADTQGTAEGIARRLGAKLALITPGDEARSKGRLLRELGPEKVVAVGNGANDVEMLREAALGIAVLGPEGLATEALLAADVVVKSPPEALELLLRPRRLKATLRK